jgi:2-amino-4-hydroxy-6-hydroxymethyldihydropteridine diphosphokinase
MNKNFTIIALGANLGDKQKNLQDAVNHLKNKINIKFCSNIYSSDALLPENSSENWNKQFYNAVLCGFTGFEIDELLFFCKSLETKISGGDRQKGNWSPRYIDIDIISFNEDIIKTDNLQIPHAKMHERNFVLAPLNDILPNWKHPVLNKTTTELLSEIKLDNLNLQKTDIKCL